MFLQKITSKRLVEGQAERFDALEEGWDARIYAVSPANRAFLQQLGAWPDASRLGVIGSMDVRGDQGGQIAFSAAAIASIRQ